MNWIQVAVGVLSLAREIFQFVKKQEQDKQKRVTKVVEMRAALKKARDKGDTEDVEKLFSELGITRKLSD